MKRFGQVIKLKPEAEEEYPIFLKDGFLFAYHGHNDEFDARMAQLAAVSCESS